MVQSLWNTVCQVLTKPNILLPYDPAITFLGIYPKELKTYVHTKNYTWMFIAALLITAKTWKQSRHPCLGQWINKMWYIQTMEYYSVLEMSCHTMDRHGRNLNAY